ncbi:MAG: Rne/Rng family ribonuclease [Pseudomonadota bacterium]
MPKKMLIDATHAEETRVVVVDGNKVDEFDFESENKRQLAGNIYLAKVTRVEPSLQAAFVDYGGNRHGFLAFSEIHPDYYQIPVADREALIAEELAYAEAAAAAEDEEDKPKRSRKRGGKSRSKAAAAKSDDAVETREVEGGIPGMDVVEPEGDDEGLVPDPEEGSSPVDRVAETPVETPAAGETDDGEGEDGGDAAVADSAGDEAPSPEATVDAEETAAEDTATEDAGDADAAEKDAEGGDAEGAEEDAPYVAMDDAAARDESIESVADDDVTEEIRQPRKPRPRKYKIQEVIKVRQILLVQVVKEERGNKGAALTTYLSLAGRYCVLMPNTARGGGISRKITNAADRKKLKEIAGEIDVPKGAGLIVRTAGAKRTKTEIKRDYEYLQRMWEQIRELTLKSIAPAQIYEEGNLIKRSIRDLYNREIDEVLVEGDDGYCVAKDFMKMIMPSHAKNVKPYTEAMPLFARYQVETYLAGMFNPTVQLKSGGYIVIGVTEALVAIDVNSGRATKKGSIEETALETNLEAAEEIARQLRLRDLAGLIVIDFIDMEERKNNSAVEKRFKDKLKTDRARIQVGRISAFGLLEMSRQRLRPGMLEATTQPCPHCHGTGLVRSDDSLGLTILRQLEEEGTRRRSREVLVKAPVSIVNFLMNHKREHIAGLETRYGMAVRIEADPFLISPDFTLEKFKTATRMVKAVTPVVSVDASLMDDLDEEVAEAEVDETEAPEAVAEDEPQPKKRRRRRRRRRGGGNGEANGDAQGEAAQDTDASETVAAELETEAAPEGEAAPEEKPKRRRSRRKKAAPEAEAGDGADVVEAPVEAEGEAAAEEAPAEETVAEEKPKRRSRSRKKAAPAEEAPVEVAEAAVAPVAAAEPVLAEEPAPVAAPEPEAVAVAEPEPVAAPEQEPVAEIKEPAVADAGDGGGDPDKPRRKGWWSLGR